MFFASVIIWIATHVLKAIIYAILAIFILHMLNQVLRTLMGYTQTRVEGFDTDGDGDLDLFIIYTDTGGIWQCTDGESTPTEADPQGCIMLSAPTPPGTTLVPILIAGGLLVLILGGTYVVVKSVSKRRE